MTLLKPLLVSAIFCSAILSGCDSDKDPDQSEDGSETSDETSMPADGVDPNNEINAELQGTWVSGCVAELPGELTSYLSVIHVIEDDTLTYDNKFFTDSDCSVPDTEDYREQGTYSLSFPEGTVETDRGTASFMDRTLESFTNNDMQPTPEMIQLADEVGVFDVEYDIYIITPEEELYFGYQGTSDEADGSSPEKRYQELYSSYSLTRQ